MAKQKSYSLPLFKKKPTKSKNFKPACKQNNSKSTGKLQKVGHISENDLVAGERSKSEKCVACKEKCLKHTINGSIKTTVKQNLKQKVEGICENHLVGKCTEGENCDYYHYILPYLWQFKRNGDWQSFEDDSSVTIEEDFCNISLSGTTLSELEENCVSFM